MTEFNLFALSSLLAAIACFINVVFVCYFGHLRIHRLLILFNVATGIWAFGGFLVGIAPSEKFALAGWNLGYIGGWVISPIFYHICCLFCKIERRPIIIFGYLQGFFFSSLQIFKPEIVFNSTSTVNHLYYHNLTFPYHCAITGYATMVLLGYLELFRYYKRCSNKDKNQCAYIICSFFFGFLFGSMCLPHFVYLTEIYPLGNFGITIYIALLTFALLKKNLLNFKVLFERSVLYSIVFSTITLLYLFFILLSENIFRHYIGHQNFYISITTATVITLFLVPSRNKLQEIIHKAFYKASPEEISIENKKLLNEVTEKEKFRAAATLASGIAHEIKNPLQAIQTFTEYLPEKYTDKTFVDKFSRLVGQEVARIDDLVHQLLDYSKPRPLEARPLDIIKLIDDTVEILSSKMIDQHIELKKNYTPSSFTLTIDASLIRQALYNILINAIEVMPHGGTLCVNTGVREPYFWIQITDTGGGITKEHIKHIFDPFFSRKDKGAGLGLSITRSIILRHQGKISVQSQAGMATAFDMNLPIKS